MKHLAQTGHCKIKRVNRIKRSRLLDRIWQKSATSCNTRSRPSSKILENSLNIERRLSPELGVPSPCATPANFALGRKPPPEMSAVVVEHRNFGNLPEASIGFPRPQKPSTSPSRNVGHQQTCNAFAGVRVAITIVQIPIKLAIT